MLSYTNALSFLLLVLSLVSICIFLYIGYRLIKEKINRKRVLRVQGNRWVLCRTIGQYSLAIHGHGNKQFITDIITEFMKLNIL